MLVIPAINMAKTGQNIVNLRKQAGLSVRDLHIPDNEVEVVQHHVTEIFIITASYPFVYLPFGNTLPCKLFPADKYS